MGRAYTVHLPPLHPNQLEVSQSDKRFKVLVAGRRFGKSRLSLLEGVNRAVNLGQDVWFISRTYNNVMTHWRNAKRLIGNRATYKNEQNKYMEFHNGDLKGSLSFKSGDRPDNLLGAGLDFAIIDEAAYCSSALWYRVVRPMLADSMGSALLISTPNGTSNWFYKVYLKGVDEHEPEWGSWVFRTEDNPFIPESEIVQAERDLPELEFRQEYLAEFVSDAGGVFRGVHNVALLDPLEEPDFEATYVAGVDWGRKNDYTVVTILDKDTGDQVFIDRFSRIGYGIQTARVCEIQNKWKCEKLYIESNAAGAPLVESLKNEGLPIREVYMTNPAKTSLVERLSLNIETGKIRLISTKHKIGELQAGELNAYEIKRTRGGLSFTYSAPYGWHDDMVVALMLANQGVVGAAQKELQFVENPFYR